MADLVEKWRLGDKDAFEALFHQYQGMVLKTARMMTGSGVEAEDVLQEVFVKVWKFHNSFNPEKGAIATWLHRITMNLCVDGSRKKRPVFVPLDAVELSDMSAGIREDDRLMNEWEYRELMGTVDSLDARHRSVIVLRYFNELSYGEIAQVLDIPLGTVKSRINQALKILRERLGGKRRKEESI